MLALVKATKSQYRGTKQPQVASKPQVADQCTIPTLWLKEVGSEHLNSLHQYKILIYFIDSPNALQ